MLKNKRKRAVVLALIAFFCTAATTYVAVDWKRFGGGFLAFLRGKGDPVAASRSGTGAGEPGSGFVVADGAPRAGAPLPRLGAATGHRHTAEAARGAGGGHQSDDDLFKYGDPAAGGIPPGSFIVAQNETPGGAGEAPGLVPALSNPQVTEPAPPPGDAGSPAPAGSNGGISDSGLVNKPGGTPPAPSPSSGTPTPPPSTTPVSPPPPVASPPANDPPAPAPSPLDPTQSGTTDPGTPVPPSPPVSAVPEASTTSMMALGALFLAVAASRQRRRS